MTKSSTKYLKPKPNSMLKRLFTIKTKAGHISPRIVQYKQINKFNLPYQQNEGENIINRSIKFIS
jgi:hypothetical protein